MYWQNAYDMNLDTIKTFGVTSRKLYHKPSVYKVSDRSTKHNKIVTIHFSNVRGNSPMLSFYIFQVAPSVRI